MDNGRGIIRYSGAAFDSFIFDHDQGAANAGFIIERITVNTVDVPEPASAIILLAGLIGLRVARNKRAL